MGQVSLVTNKLRVLWSADRLSTWGGTDSTPLGLTLRTPSKARDPTDNKPTFATSGPRVVVALQTLSPPTLVYCLFPQSQDFWKFSERGLDTEG